MPLVRIVMNVSSHQRWKPIAFVLFQPVCIAREGRMPRCCFYDVTGPAPIPPRRDLPCLLLQLLHYINLERIGL